MMSADSCRRLHIHRLRTAAAISLLLLYSWQTHAYLRVWQSDSTLWRYAYAQAPLKPRPNLFLAAVQMRSGDRAGAVVTLRRALQLSRLPHVPPWDRRDTAAAVGANLRALHVEATE